MADLVVTASSVTAGTGAEIITVTLGATFTAGQVAYLDTSDSNKAKLADANDGAAKAEVEGIMLTGGASGQPGRLLRGGNYNPGATATVGQTYIASTNAGGIAPISDLQSGSYVSILGVATSASNLRVSRINSGITRA